MEKYRVVILGSGNVATHLAKAIDKSHDVVQIYSRNKDHVDSLTGELRDCKATCTIDNLITDADIYIVAISDDSIKDIITSMPQVRGIIAHTSGSVGMESFPQGGSAGVFYPLQTFSKDTEVNITEVPFFLEASDPKTMQKLESLASSLGGKVYKADSQQRQALHIAAVFACNFVNHLLDISAEILEENGYSLDILEPLIKATVTKALEIGPHDAQTGPARRGNTVTINKHLESLYNDKQIIYNLLTQSIIDSYKIPNHHEQNRL